ncbi:MAG: DUF4390 domain-containing protein [Burkholderiales bacterium]|jgi:hypothetical protein|nr:DUF4390 domain-containing protein [Burkholderiales bacterium]
MTLRTTHTMLAWRLLATWLLCVVCVGMNVAWASEARILRIEPLPQDGQLTMDLDVALDLSRSVLDVAEHGVPLYFTYDVQITAPRWWWFDKVLVQATLSRRLIYNNLTQQWRVATGDLFLPAATQADALQVIKQVRGWPIAPVDRFEPNVKYEGKVRIRLDTSQMARPLQLDARNRGAWAMTSPWATFDFSIRRAEPAK